MKIIFFVFLSIYSWCDATASWAARHTTVCLDIINMLICCGGPNAVCHTGILEGDGGWMHGKETGRVLFCKNTLSSVETGKQSH